MADQRKPTVRRRRLAAELRRLLDLYGVAESGRGPLLRLARKSLPRTR